MAWRGVATSGVAAPSCLHALLPLRWLDARPQYVVSLRRRSSNSFRQTLLVRDPRVRRDSRPTRRQDTTRALDTRGSARSRRHYTLLLYSNWKMVGHSNIARTKYCGTNFAGTNIVSLFGSGCNSKKYLLPATKKDAPCGGGHFGKSFRGPVRCITVFVWPCRVLLI